MPELKDLLEQKSRRVDPMPDGFERLVHRRARRELNRRIGAGVIALLVAAAVVVALVRGNQFRGEPAGPPPPSVSLAPGAIAGLPRAGAKPTEFTSSRRALGYDGPDGNGNEMDMTVFTDGLMIWQRWSPVVRWSGSPAEPQVIPPGLTSSETGYVWQRLTPDGVNQLRSAMLASGLYTRSFLSDASYTISATPRGRPTGDRGDPLLDRPPTPTQLEAFHALEKRLGDPASWLPSSDWADAQIQAYVPPCYSIAVERGGVDLSKIPDVAATLIRTYMHRRSASGSMPTDDARILFRSLIGAGYTPSYNSAAVIGFNMPPTPASQSYFDPPKFGFLHFSPCMP